MPVVITEEVLQATRMTSAEVMQELALTLFQKEKLTLGQASRLAEMSQLRFQHLCASRNIPLHYDIPELEADLATLRSLGRL